MVDLLKVLKRWIYQTGNTRRYILKDNVSNENIQDLMNSVIKYSCRIERLKQPSTDAESLIEKKTDKIYSTTYEFDETMSDENIRQVAESQLAMKYHISADVELLLQCLFVYAEHPSIFDGVVINYRDIPLFIIKNKKVDEGHYQHFDIHKVRGNIESYLLVDKNIIKDTQKSNYSNPFSFSDVGAGMLIGTALTVCGMLFGHIIAKTI